MSHQSRARKPKPEIVHRSKLFGGKQSAQEVHRQHAWAGSRCYLCGDRDVVIQLSYHQSPLDLVRHEPKIAAHLIEISDNNQLPIWQSKYGPMVLYWVEYTCATHQRQVEKDAAHLPSYVMVEIDRGVGADKTVVGVPRSYEPKARAS